MLNGSATEKRQIEIGIVPTEGYNFEDMFSEKNPFFAAGQAKNRMYNFMKILEARGIALVDASKRSCSDIGLVLYFDNIQTQLLSKYKNSVNIYIALEPPAVLISNEKENLLNLKKYFDYIFSWNDDLVDGETILKLIYWVDFFDFQNDVPFESKKLLTSISGNKKSNHKDELYSKRLDVIKYFEITGREDFEFWGFGWEPEAYRNYRGSVSSKADIYMNYKFAICFENQEISGYISEKIWDCFMCKIVPVYWGAKNIDRYIPNDCFIDYRDFRDVQSLVVFLESMPKEVHQKYLDNIERFTKSTQTDKFKAEYAADIFIGMLQKQKRVYLNSSKLISLKLIKFRMKIKNSVRAHGVIGLLKRVLDR